MSKKPSKTSTTQLTDALRSYISRNRLTLLPSISELAERFHVSFAAMRKAVLFLASHGIVSCRQGRNTVVVQGQAKECGSNDEVEAGAARSLYQELKNKINTGIYPPNTLMPKYFQFVTERRISTHTVAMAFSLLQKDNCIRKSGKTWKVGPASRIYHNKEFQTPDSSHSASPVVLFIISRIRSSYDFNYAFPVSTFANAFHGELDRFGFQLKLVHVTEEEAEDFISYRMKSLFALIRNLGNRYAGALIYTKPEEMPEIVDMTNALAELKKPVVYFDFVNRASFLNRKRLSSGKHFFRCYLDEPQACRIALTTLSGLGHTTIGTPHFLSKQYDWIGQRIKTIQREAAKIRPAPTICDVQHREQFWGFDVVPDLQQFKKNLSLNRFTVQIDRLRNIRRKIPFGEELLSNPQSLLGLCRISGLTAIIAPDDNIAQEIFLFLQAFGIAIPGDMSLISFDNVSTSRYFPITTVDFGFSQAGFKVAHVFIGDMAVPVDSYGAIHTRCALVDRGSIGKPRRGELVLPFEIFPSA